MIEHLSDLRLFREICRTLNFRQAGEKLGYSPAVVTMRAGKTLFLRSTRHIAVTDEGRELLALAEKTLDLTELMAAPRQNDPHAVALQGRVRITAPHSFARVFLLPALVQLNREHPGLTLDLHLADSLTPLVKEGIDISFRITDQDEAGMEREALFLDRRILVASPDYLERNGTPQTPAQLADHACLSYTGLRHWQMDKAGQPQRVTLSRVLFSNTGDYLTQLAVAGAGITAKSDWSVHAELARGDLVPVLPDYTAGPRQTLCALIPRRDVTPVRVRCVLGLLKTHIADRLAAFGAGTAG